jgi:uncharacterized membrane protein YeaQ/YmgE (transglycosylase-associated protein family)
MARRKAHHKRKPTTHKRRRRYRVGAINQQSKDFLMTTVGGIVGAVAGSFVGKTVSNMLAKNSSTANYADYGSAGVQIVGAYLLPKLVKQKSPMLTGVQIGMAANGGLTLVKKLNIIPGIAGIGAVPMIAGYSQRRIAGTDIIDLRTSQTPMIGKTKMAGVKNMA